MGDPRRSKNKWSKPAHPWQKTRIEAETILHRNYSLKNKREIWKMTSLLKSLKDQAKNLAAGSGSQVEKEKYQLIKRTISLGLIKEGQGLDDLLGLTPESILNRRLQTIVFKKGLARSMRQARQFIVHQHILLGSTRMTAPGYVVKVGEESMIQFVPKSKLANPDHPERVVIVKTPAEQAEADSKKQRVQERKGPSRGGDRKFMKRKGYANERRDRNQSKKAPATKTK